MSRSRKLEQLALTSNDNHQEVEYDINNMPIICEDNPVLNELTLPRYTLMAIPNTDQTNDDNVMTFIDTDNSKGDEILSESVNTVSDESNDATFRIVPYSDNSDSDFNEPESVKKKSKRQKRCKVTSSSWMDAKNASNREKGKTYKGRKKMANNKWTVVPKDERKCGRRSKCKESKTIKCSTVSEETRKQLFDLFWLMKWGEEKVFLDSVVTMVPTKRPRDRKEDAMMPSMLYHLKVNEKLVRVCKTMFLNTLDIGKASVWNWKMISKNHFATSRVDNKSIALSERKQRKNIFTEGLNALKNFLDTLPKMPSHYCRQRTSKNYLLPEWDSKTALYKFYVSDWCASHNIAALSIATFTNTLDTNNIALFRPKKDQCSQCRAYKLGHISDEENTIHLARKKEARAEKEKDKENEKYAFTVDVQALLSALKSNVSSLYYKTKLCVHNFCLFNLKTRDGFCYLWNGITAEEFGSIIVQFLVDKFLSEKEVKENEKIITYSDGCTSQNRNVVLSNALLNVAVTKKVITEQKYLEVGHTQMEADSMHAAIEKRLRYKDINVPADYVNICRQARKNPHPYEVSYLNHSFFKDLICIPFYKSIRPGKTKEDPKVTDIRALQYKPDGTVNYKLRFPDNWQPLPQRINTTTGPIDVNQLPNLFFNELKITARKYSDLQDLKSTVPLIITLSMITFSIVNVIIKKQYNILIS